MTKRPTPEPRERLLRRPEVEQRTGKSRSGIYLDMRRGCFPLPVRIGMRAVAWRESDVQAWIDERGEGNAA
ncbi:helix-turn-helix transcriptional regulator [Vreelandella utahensis]|uniref:helix-turn-helix transcriptional regulator n=1 Tax=Vreelandella halophila TaxID=86177 RepID=UPI0009849E05|nr:AlpA family phage regulatory protein [Halomonas utahensis]